MLLKHRRVTILLAMLAIVASSQLWACSDYVHLWRPVIEEKSTAFAGEGIALFLKNALGDITSTEPTWRVGVNPESKISAELALAIKNGIELLDPGSFVWVDGSSPFARDQGGATIWLDFVNPERLVYVWNDQNKPPFAMFRTGEIDTARVRVLAMSAAGKVLLIDELPYMFLLESDFMLPNWVSSGGMWFRRVSFKTAQMAQRHEWTLSVPTDIEDINQTPADVRRFFFGDVPASGTRIFSNY